MIFISDLIIVNILSTRTLRNDFKIIISSIKKIVTAELNDFFNSGLLYQSKPPLKGKGDASPSVFISKTTDIAGCVKLSVSKFLKKMRHKWQAILAHCDQIIVVFVKDNFSLSLILRH